MELDRTNVVQRDPYAFISQPYQLTRRQLLALSGAAAASAFLPGCGGGGGGGQAQGDFFTARNVVMKPNVAILAEDGTVVISDLTESGLTLSGTVPALQPGQMIASGQGAGLLRRVLSVTPVGTTAVLQTEDGTFTDFFESADVSFRQAMRPQDIQDDGGVPVVRSGRADEGLHIVIPKFSISDSVDKVKFGLEAEADFVINPDVSANMSITRAQGLNSFGMSARGTFDGKYSLKLLADFPIFNRVFPYGKAIVFKPIKLGFIGPVPIILINILFTQVSVKGKLQAGWETKANGRASQEAALQMNGGVSLDKISLTNTGSATGDFTLSNFFGALEFEIALWEVEVQSTINFLFGPKFLIDFPSVKARVQANTGGLGPQAPQDMSVDVNIDAIFKATVSAKAGLLGLALPDFSLTMAERKVSLFKRNFKPGTGSMGVS